MTDRRSPLRDSRLNVHDASISPRSTNSPYRRGGGDYLQQKEMMRIHELWQASKAEVRRKERELNDSEQRRIDELKDRERRHTEEVRSLEERFLEVVERARNSEAALQEARREGDDLRHAHDAMERDIAAVSEENASLKRTVPHLEQKVVDLTERLRLVNKEKLEAIDDSLEAARSANVDASTTAEKNAMLTEKIEVQRKELDYLGEKMSKEQARIHDLTTQLERERKASKELRKQLNSSIAIATIDMDIEEENRQLKADNERLLDLVSKSKELKKFVKSVRGDVMSMSYLPSDPASSAWEMNRQTGQKPDRKVVPKKELNYWIPTEAFTLVKDFREQHMTSFPVDLFTDLLLRINDVWRRREVRKLSQVKAKYQRQIKELKRMASQRAPYHEVIYRGEIGQLKKELNKAKSTSSSKTKAGGKLLQSSLHSVESLSKQVAGYAEENRQLRLALERSQMSGTKKGKDNYMQGAAWMGKKALERLDEMGDKITLIARDFQRGMMELDPEEPGYIRLATREQNEFLDRLEKRIVGCRDKVRQYLEECLHAAETGKMTVSMLNLSDGGESIDSEDDSDYSEPGERWAY